MDPHRAGLANIGHTCRAILLRLDVLPFQPSLGLTLVYYFYKPFKTLLLKQDNQTIAAAPYYLKINKALRTYGMQRAVDALRVNVVFIPKEFRHPP